MFLKIFRQLLVTLSLVAGCMSAAEAENNATIGTVTFQVGDTRLERNGKTTSVSKSQTLQVGDRLITGPGGHIHALMVDSAFISVRPSSQLHIQFYTYAPLAPNANRIGLLLEIGTTRTISGKAGEANREHYRFNTPLAAIGLRGTDYVVQALPDATRVSVLKGAIVLSAFGSGCQANTLLLCSGPLARELTAGLSQAYLEVRAQGGLPKLVLPEMNMDTSPQKASPPRPEEPSAAAPRLVPSTLIVENLIKAQALAQRLSLPPEVLWGRWSGVQLAATPTMVSLLAEDREMTISNSLFGLLRPAGTSQLPASGTIAMNYLQGEAYLKDTAAGANQSLTPVALSQGVLQLDFNNKQFSTSLKAATPEKSISLQAQGRIDFQGLLTSNKAHSNMDLAGALSNHANEAGYLFDANLSPTQTLTGATRWSR